MVDGRVNKWLRYWVDGLFPARCILCAAATHRELDLCLDCERDLPRTRDPCPRCGLPRTGSPEAPVCGHCLRQPLEFQHCVSLFHYQAPVSRLIAAFKYRRRMLWGRVMGELLAREIRTRYRRRPLPQAVLPVPLHWRRLEGRGFNQARALSTLLAKELELPHLGAACRRVRATATQTRLSAPARRRNLAGAFRLHNRQGLPARVALVDDVVTTGTTVNELSRLLQKSGSVAEVHVWCLARALPPAA